MRALHQFAVMGLFVSLSLAAASCVPETTEPDDPDPGAASEGPDGRSEGALAEPGEDALAEPGVEPQGDWCRPEGAYCKRDHQCCSGDCRYGECQGGGYCKHAGEYCYKNYECCSHDCSYGECQHGY